MKNSRLRQDLPISINDRLIFPFREGFIFTQLLICRAPRDRVSLNGLGCVCFAGVGTLIHVDVNINAQ